MALQRLCYVAIDYEGELRKDTEASYEVPVEGLFTLKQERFRTGEILFQPRIAGLYVHLKHMIHTSNQSIKVYYLYD